MVQGSRAELGGVASWQLASLHCLSGAQAEVPQFRVEGNGQRLTTSVGQATRQIGCGISLPLSLCLAHPSLVVSDCFLAIRGEKRQKVWAEGNGFTALSLASLVCVTGTRAASAGGKTSEHPR